MQEFLRSLEITCNLERLNSKNRIWRKLTDSVSIRLYALFISNSSFFLCSIITSLTGEGLNHSIFFPSILVGSLSMIYPSSWEIK